MSLHSHWSGMRVWANTASCGWRAGIIAHAHDTCAHIIVRGGHDNSFDEEVQYAFIIRRLPRDRLNRPGWLDRPQLNLDPNA